MNATLLSSVLITVIASAGAPAYAGVHPARNAPDALETTVRFSDLDLNRAQGAELMLARLDRAARAVCGEEPGPREIAKRARYKDCVATAMTTAVASVDAPLVTARYNGRMSARLAAN